jgi:hypothetical protein
MLIAFTTILIISCSAPREIVHIKRPIYQTVIVKGEGDYTIVMEAGMGNWSLFYQPVFQELKKKTKVCIIDRAGYAMDAVSSNSKRCKNNSS